MLQLQSAINIFLKIVAYIFRLHQQNTHTHKQRYVTRVEYNEEEDEDEGKSGIRRKIRGGGGEDMYFEPISCIVLPFHAH